jgi:hypothetical protein
MTIISRERIATEALKASEQFDDVNAACPYPFGEPSGQLFKQIFNEAVRQQKAALALANTAQAATKGIAA